MINFFAHQSTAQKFKQFCNILQLPPSFLVQSKFFVNLMPAKFSCFSVGISVIYNWFHKINQQTPSDRSIVRPFDDSIAVVCPIGPLSRACRTSRFGQRNIRQGTVKRSKRTQKKILGGAGIFSEQKFKPSDHGASEKSWKKKKETELEIKWQQKAIS